MMSEMAKRVNPGDLPGWIVLDRDEAADVLDALRAAMGDTADPGRFVVLIQLADLIADRIEGDI